MQKRLFDLLFTLPGVLLLSPAMLLIALLIIFDSPGPVIFRQVRVGQYGRPFTVLKFRTMVNDAESRGPSITSSSDARITSAGRFLRKFKLDELPQLINVIKGDMSLVGPRPEMHEYVELYPEAAKKKTFSVRPGMTDNASIEFRNESTILSCAADPEREYIEKILPTKLAMYSSYVDEQSFWGDLVLLARTVRAVIFH